jgi:molybdopterin converting factor small subunit
MIRVRCLGHIRTCLGADIVEVEGDGIEATDIIDRLRARAGSADPGFDRYNTLAIVGEGEAFIPASSRRKVRDGETVVLLPFSHGG